MLIDDEIEQLLPLADVLRRAGVASTIATSDAEAVFEVRVSPPDLVLIDAEMAARNLLSRIRALAAELPVVLMIGVASYDPEIAAMLAIDGVSVIEKPVDARQLLRRLSDASRAAFEIGHASASNEKRPGD